MANTLQQTAYQAAFSREVLGDEMTRRGLSRKIKRMSEEDPAALAKIAQNLGGGRQATRSGGGSHESHAPNADFSSVSGWKDLGIGKGNRNDSVSANNPGYIPTPPSSGGFGHGGVPDLGTGLGAGGSQDALNKNPMVGDWKAVQPRMNVLPDTPFTETPHVSPPGVHFNQLSKTIAIEDPQAFQNRKQLALLGIEQRLVEELLALQREHDASRAASPMTAIAAKMAGTAVSGGNDKKTQAAHLKYIAAENYLNETQATLDPKKIAAATTALEKAKANYQAVDTLYGGATEDSNSASPASASWIPPTDDTAIGGNTPAILAAIHAKYKAAGMTVPGQEQSAAAPAVGTWSPDQYIKEEKDANAWRGQVTDVDIPPKESFLARLLENFRTPPPAPLPITPDESTPQVIERTLRGSGEKVKVVRQPNGSWDEVK